MGILPSLQPCESKKVRLRRRSFPVPPPTRVRPCGARQEGLGWQRKMRSLSLRLSKGQRRRDRSGAPMKRG